MSAAPQAVAAAQSHRRLRAAVAERLLAKAPHAAVAIDWEMLDHAPSWLALPSQTLAMLERQVGAVLCAPALRLWIDRPRLAAASDAVGPRFLQALLAAPDTPALQPSTAVCPHIESAAEVAALLQAAGAAVLLATLPAGGLRHAAAALLSPAVPLDMAPPLAQALLARVRTVHEVTQ